MILAIFLVIAALLLVLGIVFALGKGTSLIAGYNTATEYERSKINKKALCRAMSKMMFALAFSFALCGFGVQFGVSWLNWVGGVLFGFFIVGGVIYMNTSKNIKK